MATATEIARSIEIARTYLTEHPEEARYSDSLATAVMQDGLCCRVEGPAGALVSTDMPSGVGGDGSAPSPGWLARAAHASCDATLISMRAAELGLPLQRVEVRVDSESDDRGLLALDAGVSPGPLGVRVRVRISAPGVEPQVLRDLVDWAEAHSPVSDAIRRAVPVSVEVEPAEAGLPA